MEITLFKEKVLLMCYFCRGPKVICDNNTTLCLICGLKGLIYTS